MKARILSIFVTLSIAALSGSAVAQCMNTADTAAAVHHPLGMLQAFLGGEQFMAHHPKLAKAWKFLNNAEFRSELEAPMTSADKQTIEAAVVDIKSNFKALREMKPQFVVAREAHDKEEIYRLLHTVRPNLDQIRTDRRTILDLLAKYKFAKASNSSSLAKPIFPNPVRVGGAPATVTYQLKKSGPVTITVTDASGNIVQQISNTMETEGEHSITLGSAITKPGSYYVTIEADNMRSAQKLAVVE